MSDIKKNQQKGRRYENEARRILEQCYGHASQITDTRSPNGRTDLFRCADLIAVKYGHPVKLVQVKSNSEPSDGDKGLAPSFTDNEHTQLEFWSRIDYEGWRIYQYQVEKKFEGKFIKLFEINTCDIDKAAKIYLDKRYDGKIHNGR